MEKIYKKQLKSNKTERSSGDNEIKFSEAKAFLQGSDGAILCCFNGSGKKCLIKKIQSTCGSRVKPSIIYLSQRQFRLSTTGSIDEVNSNTLYSYVECAKSLKKEGFIVLVDTLKGFHNVCDLVVLKENYVGVSKKLSNDSFEIPDGWRKIVLNRWLNYCVEYNLRYVKLEDEQFLSSLIEEDIENV